MRPDASNGGLFSMEFEISSLSPLSRKPQLLNGIVSKIKNNWNVWTESNSFILFLPDFVLAFDGRKDLLGFCCPLSGFFELSRAKLCESSAECIDPLIDDYNDAQAQFIARRLVQLTGLSWEFDCLAKFEQELPEYRHVLSKFTDLFSGASLGLEFPSLEDIVGFKVGLIEKQKGPGKYDVALHASKTMFGLIRPHKRALYHPAIIRPASLIVNMDEELDAVSICVGGTHNILNLLGRSTPPTRRHFHIANCEKLQN